MSCGCHNYQIKGFNYKPKKLYCEARFYSPDLYIQAPDMAQNFNRYTYCMNNPLIYSYPRGMSWFSDIWDGFWSLINGDYNSQTGQYEGGVAQIFRNMNVPDFEVGYNSGMGSFYRLGNNDRVYPSYNSAVNKGLKQTNKNIELAVNYNSPMNGTLNDKFNKYFSDYIYRNSVRLVYDPTL